MLPIYLDSHASTPLDPRVLKAMMPWLTSQYGNSASAHFYGREAAQAVEQVRADVALCVQAQPEEVCFTSGATESNNQALCGGMEALAAHGKNHLIISPFEHSSVDAVARRLEKKGIVLTVLPVGSSGIIDPADVARAITPKTGMVSVMSANNEIGTVQPIRALGHLCKERGVVFHTDACQGFGRVELSECPVGEPCVALADLISLSAHKLYGPKGIGALVIRKTTPLVPFLLGGTHEQGRRAGTLNTPGIVGLGMACVILEAEWPEESLRLQGLRDRLLEGLLDGFDGLVVNGALGPGNVRLPHNLNVTFLGVCPTRLEKALDDRISISSASACLAGGAPKPSRVITAIGGHGPDEGATIRFGLGRFTTQDEVDFAAQVVVNEAQRLRAAGCSR